MRTTENMLNTMIQNATQEQITAAYRDLVGMDDPERMGKWKQFGIYQQHANASKWHGCVESWIRDRANEIKHGLHTLARLCGCSLAESDALSKIESQAIEALRRQGVSEEKSATQLRSEAAFAACGGTIRAY